jgi:hypothetical protein
VPERLQAASHYEQVLVRTPSASQVPCLSGVAKLPDGDWVATLWNDHNGYMK